MKTFVLLIVALLIVNTFATREFSRFVEKYNKKYDKAEFAKRRGIFLNNVMLINKHNAEKEKHGYTLAVNEFADLTHEEFKKFYLAPKFDATQKQQLKIKKFPKNLKLPTSVDWVTKGAVTHIKNQGQCGSCWSFSTTGSVEGQYFLKTGTLRSFSEQQLVDCSQSFGNQGCNGGLMDDAFKYIISTQGIETESEYPYTAQTGSCHAQKSLYRGDITGYQDIQSGSEDDLQAAVANIGPISVAIDAGESSFQFYSGGVYYSASCSPTQLDHGVLAVGYGVYQGTTDYWLVKNSWGTSWGLNGYIMMSRNRNNNCGIATMASYPTGAQNPPLAKKFQKLGKMTHFNPTQ